MSNPSISLKRRLLSEFDKICEKYTNIPPDIGPFIEFDDDHSSKKSISSEQDHDENSQPVNKDITIAEPEIRFKKRLAKQSKSERSISRYAYIARKFESSAGCLESKQTNDAESARNEPKNTLGNNRWMMSRSRGGYNRGSGTWFPDRKIASFDGETSNNNSDGKSSLNLSEKDLLAYLEWLIGQGRCCWMLKASGLVTAAANLSDRLGNEEVDIDTHRQDRLDDALNKSLSLVLFWDYGLEGTSNKPKTKKRPKKQGKKDKAKPDIDYRNDSIYDEIDPKLLREYQALIGMPSFVMDAAKPEFLTQKHNFMNDTANSDIGNSFSTYQYQPQDVFHEVYQKSIPLSGFEYGSPNLNEEYVPETNAYTGSLEPQICNNAEFEEIRTNETNVVYPIDCKENPEKCNVEPANAELNEERCPWENFSSMNLISQMVERWNLPVSTLSCSTIRPIGTSMTAAAQNPPSSPSTALLESLKYQQPINPSHRIQLYGRKRCRRAYIGSSIWSKIKALKKPSGKFWRLVKACRDGKKWDEGIRAVLEETSSCGHSAPESAITESI